MEKTMYYKKQEEKTMKKSMKRTLALSVLSLVLCMAMLVGTTFTWFTDTATTGVNKIQAGNLDVKLRLSAFPPARRRDACAAR